MDYLVPRKYRFKKNLDELLYNYFGFKYKCLSLLLLGYYLGYKHNFYGKVGN